MARRRDAECTISDLTQGGRSGSTLYKMELELATGEKDQIVVGPDRDISDQVIHRHHERVLLSNGGSVDYQRLSVDQDMVITAGSISGKKLIIAMIALEGEYSMTRPEDGSEILFSSLQGHLFVHEGLETSFTLPGGQDVQSLGLSLTPEIFARYFDNNVPAALQSLLDGDAGTIDPIGFPVSSAMRETLIQNLRIETSPSLQQIKMEGIGLLYLTLIEQSLRVTTDVDDGQPLVKRADIDKAQRAYQILQDNLREPPCLSDLSIQLGITEKRLNQAFRELYSDTVFEVLRDVRMEKAKILLERTDMAIKEVAWDVGYNHSTNFSTAFNQKYGIPPAEYVRKVRSGAVRLVKNA
ncbi:helix-turn-helix transcriptional regulator [Thalassospira australica]|uniref:helix-turn-helix transcriptional regulator n=1 Tax=Thalassospira australica TaxID=1528106 RepID=UPI0009DD76D7|nr:AraC family transcriptional regulator [Thalassospira australica]